MPIMRLPILLSDRSIRDAKAYMANPDASHAVEALIDSYGALVADLRKLRSRVRQFDSESAELDDLVQKLRDIGQAIDQL